MTCDKIGYPTVKAARTALNSCKSWRRKKRRRREQSFYRCDGCGDYHLTSQPPDEKHYT